LDRCGDQSHFCCLAAAIVFVLLCDEDLDVEESEYLSPGHEVIISQTLCILGCSVQDWEGLQFFVYVFNRWTIRGSRIYLAQSERDWRYPYMAA
jgi:hypothetical protein